MSVPQATIEVRARSLGEILDDAWRLFLQDLSPLTFLSWLFNAPWASALLWAFTRPTTQYSWLWATLTAALFLLGSVGSGACQELLRQRAAGRRASIGACLKSAFATMPQHLGIRVLAWLLLITAIVLTYQGVLAADRVMAKVLACFFLIILLIVPGLVVWSLFIPAHALLAAHGGSIGAAFRASRREVGRQAGKALSLFLVRIIVFLVTMINLVALTHWGMGMAESVLGLELSFLQQFLGIGNAAFTLSLTLLTMLFLTPYFEVVNYLFHLDARARYEGLDLWYRVQRQFPAPTKVSAAGIVLALILLCPLGSAYAQQVPPPGAPKPPPKGPVVLSRKAVDDLEKVYESAHEIRKSAFNGRDWHDRLITLSLESQIDRLPSQVRQWIETAARRIFDPDEKVEVSEDTARVAMKELLENLYAMLQSVRKADRYPDKDLVKQKAGAEPGRIKPKPTKPDPPEDPPPPPPPPNPPQPGNNRPIGGGPGFNPGPRAAPSVPIGAGATGLMWVIIIVCIAGGVAVVAAVSFKAWKAREKKPEQPKVQPQAHPEADAIEQLLSEPVKGSNPWTEADELAQRGEPTEAIRLLYVKLLVLLHRANLIRYERTRTNGEYVRMLRSRPEIQKPFRQLTHTFELKWYGKRPCEVNEYYACRDLADLIHGESSRHG